MTLFVLPLLLLAGTASFEARSHVAAMGSSPQGLLLLVTVEGDWEERRPTGTLVRRGQVDLGPGHRWLERAAIAPDGTRWAAVVRESTGAASVLVFEWGQRAWKRRWAGVTMNVEEVRWWGDRLVLRTDGDGVRVLGAGPLPERSFPSSSSIAVAGDLLLMHVWAECWSPPKGVRFACLRQESTGVEVDVRNTAKAGAVERTVTLPLERGESLLELALGVNGTTFVASTSNRTTDAIHHLVVTLDSGHIDRRADANRPPILDVSRTYTLLTVVSSSVDRPPRAWTTPATGVLSALELAPTRLLVGSGSTLSRLDTTNWTLERLSLPIAEGHGIHTMALGPGGKVVIIGLDGVDLLVGKTLSAVHRYEEPQSSAHVTQDHRWVLTWGSGSPSFSVLPTGLTR